MSESNLSDDQLLLIAAIKQKYWAGEGIAKDYQYCAFSPEPITRAKNLTEIGLVLRNVLGPRVLDAGAGTGRFTFPLRQADCEAVALDISLEMLGEGLRRGRKTGQSFPCLAGDIGQLPFRDDTFDSVVSITVLRHFPQWPQLLKEYIRVVRRGGRILFDMASGDQRAYLHTHGIAKPDAQENHSFDPLEFNAAVSMKELLGFARENGCAVLRAAPYDLFNANDLLDHILGDFKEPFDQAVCALLKTEGGITFYELITRRFLAALSPAVTPSWFIVLEKNTHKPYEAPYRQLQASSLAGHEAATLVAILKKCLGPQLTSYFPELAEVLENPDAQRLMAICWKELLPRFPLEILYWEAD